MANFAAGGTLLLDGKAWVLEAHDGVTASATREEANGRSSRVRFDVRELVDMGQNLFSLPGRLETPAPRADEIGVAALTLEM